MTQTDWTTPHAARLLRQWAQGLGRPPSSFSVDDMLQLVDALERMRSRHQAYSHAIGCELKRSRSYRPSGEPAQCDAHEICKLVSFYLSKKDIVSD